MKEVYLQIIGLIIGLGAVTVIDWLGFVSRKSVEWTHTTIKAHHVTKPLIWVGTFLIFLGILFEGFSLKYWVFLIMVLNGCFLSFYVSPRLDKMYGKKKLLSNKFQIKIAISTVISFVSWWSFVYLVLRSL
jgi:hypothetical protein